MNKRSPKPVRLLDAVGNAVIGYVERSTLVADPWLGRRVHLYVGVHYRYDALRARARIQFVGSTKWYEARNVFAPPRAGETPNVPLMRALRQFSHEHWWVSTSGAIERRATLYEERLPAAGPHGCVLVTSEVIAQMIGSAKRTGVHIPKGETEQRLDEAVALAYRARALEHAKQTLAHHTDVLAKAQKMVDKWTLKVAKLAGDLI